MNKKIFVIILAFVVVFSLAACGAGKANEQIELDSEKTATPGVVKTETNDGNIDEEVAVENSTNAEPEAFADAEAAAYHTPAPNATAAPVATPVPTKAPAPEEETEDADSETEGDYQPSVGLTEYELYNAMSGEEQQAFMESFGSVEAFMSWYNSAREEYESGRIEIDGSEINAGDLVG